MKHPLRREQINKVVTSGVSPNGGVSGYGSLGKQLEVKAREMERELEGCEGSTALEQLERIMVWDLKVGHTCFLPRGYA